MSTTAKKYKSKMFRVAVEGATTDGRKIERSWIQQMAKNFDPQKYGARIWLEHIRGVLPESSFRAYGDVIAVKAEEVNIGGTKKLALFAQIEPTDDLIAMTKAKQKIYTSVEINEKFADTNEAYLVGLGVTDSPASLGTEVLSFASQQPNSNPFSARKQDANNLFSEAVEIQLEFEEVTTEDNKFMSKVKDLIKTFSTKSATDDQRFNDVQDAMESLLEHVVEQDKKFKSQSDLVKQLQSDLKTVTDKFTEFKSALEKQPGNDSNRPPSDGGSGGTQTEF
ncbi:GPO family capsid scaffolding protein [Undibacterium danionis]|uniref:GPO family capsid scaffolding protein n=1 Tax=Undibacterium danionis TaxID=1812100 RepID=A0ABV6IIZ4_9BURK